MDLILIRHGEPDYSQIDKNESTIMPTKAHLSSNGIEQAKNIFKGNEDLLKDYQIILTSPFGRALDTAKILNESLNLPFFIEDDLHEWLPDRFFKHRINEISCFYKDYKMKKGIRIENEPWESDEEVIKRFKKCLKKYENYDKIIIVAHSRLFKINFDIKECNYCSLHYFYIDDTFFN